MSGGVTSEWLANMDRYRAGGRGGSDRGAYLRLYNGTRFVVDRVGRGTLIASDGSPRSQAPE